jgi:uncharacterized protein
MVIFYEMFIRTLTEPIQAALRDTPVVLLVGARQTGKSTLVEAIAEEHEMQYLSLDDVNILALAKEDPSAFVSNYRARGPVVIDEIQRAPELFLPIKAYVDKRRMAGGFLLTGSANVLTLPQVSDSLAGRIEVLELWPLAQSELGKPYDLLECVITGVWPHRITGESEVLEALVRGGFPEALERSEPSRREAWFRSYLGTVLSRDVRDLAQIEGLYSLPNLLTLLAGRSASLLNLADLARDAGLPHTTLKRYLSLLKALFLHYELPAYSSNIAKRFVKASKLHVSDTGLLCHLLRTSREKLETDRKLLGQVLETFVVNEFRKHQSWLHDYQLYHYRTHPGEEIDLILDTPKGLIAIEVKASQTLSSDSFKTLRAFAAESKKPILRGIVFYLGQQMIPFGDKLEAVPVGVLLG